MAIQQPETGPVETRARAHPRARAPFRILKVGVVPGERRNPLFVADVAIGAVTLTYGISFLKSLKLEVRPPFSAGGGPGVLLPPEMAEAVEAAVIAAVQAYPEVAPHLAHRPRAARY